MEAASTDSVYRRYKHLYTGVQRSTAYICDVCVAYVAYLQSIDNSTIAEHVICIPDIIAEFWDQMHCTAIILREGC